MRSSLETSIFSKPRGLGSRDDGAVPIGGGAVSCPWSSMSPMADDPFLCDLMRAAIQSWARARRSLGA